MAREKNLKAKQAWAQLLASETKIPWWRSHKSLPRIPKILCTSILLSVDLLSQFLYIVFKNTGEKKFSKMFVIYILYIYAGTFSIVAHKILFSLWNKGKEITLREALRNQCVFNLWYNSLLPCDATFFMEDVGQGNEMTGPAGFLVKFMGMCGISYPNQC